MHESDLERYILETTFLWSMVEDDLERHVLEFLDDGYENVILGCGPVKVWSKESHPKLTLLHEGKAATFEFQAHPLFDLFVRIMCATCPSSSHCRYRFQRLERELTKFPVKLKMKGTKKKKKKEKQRKNMGRGKTLLSVNRTKKKQKMEKKKTCSVSAKCSVFSKKSCPSLWEGWPHDCGFDFSTDGLGGLRKVGANEIKSASREFFPVLSGQSA